MKKSKVCTIQVKSISDPDRKTVFKVINPIVFRAPTLVPRPPEANHSEGNRVTFKPRERNRKHEQRVFLYHGKMSAVSGSVQTHVVTSSTRWNII